MQLKLKQIHGFFEHVQDYVRLRGRAGGQQIIGGEGNSEDLVLESNGGEEKGVVIIQPNGGGTIMGAPTGGAQGDGTVNAQGIFINGEDVRDHARRFAFFHG